MMHFYLLIKKIKTYLILLSCFFVVAVVFLIAFGKDGSFLWLNQYHNNWLDLFFSKYTFFGDGLFAVLLSVILFFFIKTQRLSMILLSAYIVSGLLAQLLKRLFNAPRPKAFFTPEQYNKFVDGVTVANSHSFPSGHTTTAFGMAIILAYFTSNKYLQSIFFILALTAGFSRIYLGQHFLTDVLAGAILGSFISLCAILISNSIPNQKPVQLLQYKKSNQNG